MGQQNLNSIQAARYLTVSKSKLMKMCHKREIKYYKCGRLNVFREDDLHDYLEEHRVLTAKELQQEAENLQLNKVMRAKF